MKQVKIGLLFSFVLILGLGLWVAKLSFAAIGDGHFVHSCVKNSSGGVRIVDASDTCAGNETALKWNSDGVDDFGGFTTKNLTNIELNNQNFNYRNLKGGDFTQSNLSNSLMKFSSFKNAKFIMTDLSAVFANSADFSGAVLNDVQANNANFDNANFTNTIITGSSFIQTAFRGANLNGSAITGSQFNGPFDNAILLNITFNNVILTGSSGLDTASRTGVTWSNTTCPDGTNSDGNGDTCEGHLIP